MQPEWVQSNVNWIFNLKKSNFFSTVYDALGIYTMIHLINEWYFFEFEARVRNMYKMECKKDCNAKL